MIFDDFSSLSRYVSILPVQEIQKFTSRYDLTRIPNGEIEISGRDLFVRVAEYATGPADEKKFEAHAVYADLQLIASGVECMEVLLDKTPLPVTDYDEKADIQFYQASKNISQVCVSAGQFTVFFPGELHRPGCIVEGVSSRVKKLVFKIRVMYGSRS